MKLNTWSLTLIFIGKMNKDIGMSMCTTSPHMCKWAPSDFFVVDKMTEVNNVIASNFVLSLMILMLKQSRS